MSPVSISSADSDLEDELPQSIDTWLRRQFGVARRAKERDRQGFQRDAAAHWDHHVSHTSNGCHNGCDLC
jgi:hypothetical protein